MTRVIDVHTHLGVNSLPEGCEEVLHRASSPNLSLRAEGIEVEKVLLVPSFPCGNRSCSDGFYQQVEWRRGKEEWTAQWGSLNPLGCEDIRKEAERQYDLGIVGFKIHPVHHGYAPNAYREEEGGMKPLETIYQFAEDHDLPLLVHTGTSIGERSRNKYGDPILLDDVVKDFKIRVILAHGGRPLWYNSAFFLARMFRNAFLEISSIPPKALLREIPRLKEIKEKVLYGSDFPNYKNHDLALHALAVYEETRDEDIMYHNAKRLLRL